MLAAVCSPPEASRETHEADVPPKNAKFTTMLTQGRRRGWQGSGCVQLCKVGCLRTNWFENESEVRWSE